MASGNIQRAAMSETVTGGRRSHYATDEEAAGMETKEEEETREPEEDAASHPATRAQGIRRNLFLILITLSQLVQMIPLGAGMTGGRAMGAAFNATPLEIPWTAASYPLTQGSFVMIGGRLGAVYGHKAVFTVGCVWWVVWAFAGGYATNMVSFCLMRGLCGIGGGLMVPNIVALIGTTLPPGPKRNLGFALFGAAAPVGAAGGALVSVVVIQLAGLRWMFLMLGLLGFVVYGAAIFTVDADEPMDPNGVVDWVGAYFGVAGLVLFNFVWNQAPSSGWSSRYEIVLLILSVVHFAVFCFWEMRIAKEPILPFHIWSAPSFGRLILAISFAFMSIGVFLWYINIYMETIRGDSMILAGVQLIPLTLGGAANAFLSAWLVPRLPAQAIIGLGCLAVVAMNVLLSLLPHHLTYWAMAFPAIALSSFTIDLITTAAQIIASNAVSRRYQGVAGSLVGTLMGYGMSTGIGFAGTVEVHTFDDGRDALKGYHAAGYLSTGLGVAALLLAASIRMPKNNREGWQEEDQA